jgi:hypothetical protein
VNAGAGGQGTRSYPNDPPRSEQPFQPDNARCTICSRPAPAPVGLTSWLALVAGLGTSVDGHTDV